MKLHKLESGRYTVWCISMVMAATLLVACAAPKPKQPANLPAGFVHLTDVVPGVPQDIRYYGHENFLGRPVAGYQAPVCILSIAAAQALKQVQAELFSHGLTVKVFDCYRPQTSVNDFVRWGQDLGDQTNKASYYPNVPKQELFARGYIAERSGHSRGSTVDLTLQIIDWNRAQAAVQGSPLGANEVDMGSPFDLFDVRSHTEDSSVSLAAQHNRRWFRGVMERHGFHNYAEEWWHYTLRDEPFSDRYFDFPVR